MEPTTAPARPGKGTLTDPEVLQDVPGHVIPILEREFDDFDRESGAFLEGGRDETEFIKFRLKQGVYGQRQPDVQMIRVKLPFGGVSPEQMETFADAIERYVPLEKGHITTRQNVQVHHVPLRDAAKFIRLISEAGLSSREGCGNTMRNVTGDPWAGVAPDEVFDPTPYAGAYVRYFVRHPTTQAMPRKVKTSFTSSDVDRAISGIHDVAFLPVIRDGVRGFRMLVGGGTAIMPRIAQELYDFVGADDGEYLKVTEAVMRIFDRQEWLRVNRARARIKVFIDKFGVDEMRRQVEEELRGDWVAERDFGVAPLAFVHDEEANAPKPHPEGHASPNGDLREFDRFRASNVLPQRQEGYVTVEVAVPRGDLSPAQFRGLAAIMREYCGGYARTTVGQNLVLRWVREEAVYEVWKRLEELGLGEHGAQEVIDVVSCPGTDSCKLGITSSMGLNAAVRERLREMDITDELTRKVQVKMSGCPNGCGQHHIGSIGFYGASIKVGEHTIPAYVAHVGGSHANGGVAFGERLRSACPPSACRTRSSGGCACTRPSAPTRRRPSPRTPSGSGPRASRTRRATCRSRSSSASRRCSTSSTGPRTFPSRSCAARASARCDRAPRRLARGDRRRGRGAPRRPSRPAVLVPEGGVGAGRRGHPAGPRNPGRHDRHRGPLPGDPPDLEGVRGPLRRARRGAGRDGPVDRARALLHAGEGRGARARARGRGGLDHRHPPRAVRDARERAARRARRGAGRLEVQPARRLDRSGPLAAHRRPGAAVPPAARSRLRLDRLRAVHAARRGPRRPLGRHPEDRVRPARDGGGPLMDPLVVCFGLGVGVLVGLTGIGGGSLMTPLLLIFVGTNPLVAVGHRPRIRRRDQDRRRLAPPALGTVDLGVSKWLAFGSVPASVAGVVVGDRIAHSTDEALLWAVAGALFLVAFVTLFRAVFLRGLVARERHTVELRRRTRITSVLLGAVLGFVLGVTSVGSGALVGLALILVFRLTPHRWSAPTCSTPR